MNPQHELRSEDARLLTRCWFFRQCGVGLGSIAVASLLDAEKAFGASKSVPTAAANPLGPKEPHFKPKAKRIIFLFMAGAPSQLDLFDYKAKLNQYDGRPVPEDVIKGERFAFIKGTPKLLGSPHNFARYGQCGAELSNLLPHLATIVDDIAIVKSLHTTQFNHAPGQIFMSSGHQIPGRPSMGSWLTYGLGSECSNLPGFVV